MNPAPSLGPVPSLRALPGGRALLVAAFAAPVALRALSFQDSLLDRDEAYWLAAALRMRDEGLPPYLAGWDTKPPLVFAHHRLALAIAPGAPLLAAHVLGAVLAGAACALVAAAARRAAGALAGAVAALAFALLDSTGTVKALAANTEILTYLPVAALCWCLAAGKPRGVPLAIAAGACGAAAALARQTSGLFLPFGALAVLLSPAGPGLARTALGAAVGAASVFAVAFAPLALAGAWEDVVACLWTLSLHRAAVGADLGGGAGYAGWLATAVANPVIVLGPVAVVVCAVTGPTERREPARTAVRLVGPLLVAGTLAAVAGGAAFHHYLRQAYVPASVLAGVGLVCVARRVTRPRIQATVAIVAALLVAAAAADDRARQWRSRRWTRYESDEALAAATRVRESVPADGRLFVWGMHPDLYVLARRTPATRFTATGWLVGTYTGGATAPGAEPFELVPGCWDRLFADLEARPPDAIVDSAPAGVHGFDAWPISRFPRLAAWVEARYDAVEDPPGRYLLWRLRGRR